MRVARRTYCELALYCESTPVHRPLPTWAGPSHRGPTSRHVTSSQIRPRRAGHGAGRKRAGFASIVVPAANRDQAAFVEGINVYAVPALADAIASSSVTETVPQPRRARAGEVQVRPAWAISPMPNARRSGF